MPHLRLVKGRGSAQERGPYLVRESASQPPDLRLLPPGGGARIVDLRRHRETYKGFKIEVWQVAASCGTARPRFYCLRYNLDAKTPTPLRDKSEFSELDAAIRHIRRRADRWRYLLDKRPQIAEPATHTRRRRRTHAMPVYKAPEQLGPPITISDITDHVSLDAAPCPACDKIVSRTFTGLSAHLNAHVRKRLITLDQKREIMGRLVNRRRAAV